MKWLGLFFLLFFSLAQAASFPSFSCPNTFRNVNIGDSTETVRSACGNPTTTTTRQEQVSTPIMTTRWVYTAGVLKSKDVIVTLPTLVITFRDQKAVKIEKNGFAITGGSSCALTGSVNLGDSMDIVLQSCGQPSFVNNQQEMETSAKEVLEWIYNYGPYRPQIIFDFENGVVTQISSGALGS